MQLIVDFMLLAASGAAAIYCFVLSARLRKLNDMRGGLGAGIASMTVALEETRRMLAQSRDAHKEAEESLKALIEEAERAAAELFELVEPLLAAADQTADAASGPRGRPTSAARAARERDIAA